MGSGLTAEIHARLDSITPEEWRRLFPDYPDSGEMISLIQDSGFDGFNLHSIVIRQDQGHQPILFLPIFETEYKLNCITQPRIRKLIETGLPYFQKLLTPKLVGIGFVEGEWGQIGYEHTLNDEDLMEAWILALESFKALSYGLKADLLAWVDFNTESGQVIPISQLQDYIPLKGLPYARVPLPFKTLDDYFANLSRSTRKNMRRKLRKAQGIEIIRTKDPKPWMEIIYQYYMDTLIHHDLYFGIHHQDYFAEVCNRVPGAEYTLYFLNGRLLAFNLLVASSGELVDKYFGMDEVLGQKYSLYFLSWIENIRYCIDNNIPVYSAGAASEEVKDHLGAEFKANMILFKHQNPIIHWILKQFKSAFDYPLKIDLPEPVLGRRWQQRPVLVPAITVKSPQTNNETSFTERVKAL